MEAEGTTNAEALPVLRQRQVAEFI